MACWTSARGRCCTASAGRTPILPAAASRWASGSTTWRRSAATRAACARQRARSSTRSSSAIAGASTGSSTIRGRGCGDRARASLAARAGVRLDGSHQPGRRPHRLLLRCHGDAPALAHEPRVHPGPDHLPAPARAELLQPGRGPGREAGGMARRRVGCSRHPRAGSVDPPRPHLAVLPRGLHSPRDLGHAWHGGGGGGARVRHHGADDPGGHSRSQIVAPLGGHLPPRGAAPRQHRPRHPPRGAAVPLVASTARRLVIVDLARLTWTFLWLSLICVGGGLGVIPELQRQVVDRFHWVTAREFLDGYTLSQLTPGPTMLVSVFVGYRAHGVPGAVLATAAMFLPTAVITAIITRHWATLRDRPWVRATERALAPVGIGLRAAGGCTLARAGVLV